MNIRQLNRSWGPEAGIGIELFVRDSTLTATQRLSGLRWLALIGLIPVACVLLYVFRDELSFQRLAEHDTAVRTWCRGHRVASYSALFVIYTAATGASIPAAAGMTVAAGWILGFWPAFILTSFASTSGATAAFLVSRRLLRERVRERFADRLKEIEAALERDGASYLFLLRLVPLLPFFVINIVMGLTPMRVFTFWWVSQLGMLPGTALYVAAGASMPTLKVLADQGVTGVVNFRVLGLFTILGLMPIVARRLYLQWRRHQQAGSAER